MDTALRSSLFFSFLCVLCASVVQCSSRGTAFSSGKGEMQQRMRRRRMLGIAAQAGEAILAACGGGAPGTAVRQASVSSVVNATGALTPAVAPASDLLRMLAFVPDPLDRWQCTAATI